MARRKKLKYCQVCGVCVAHLSSYCKRFKVCHTCKQKPEVTVNNIQQRFCNKCGHFEPLHRFDGEKKTCRVKLEIHNNLRKSALRKIQQKSSKPKKFKKIAKNLVPPITSPPDTPASINELPNNNNTVNCNMDIDMDIDIDNNNNTQCTNSTNNNNQNANFFFCPNNQKTQEFYEEQNQDAIGYCDNQINQSFQLFQLHSNFQFSQEKSVNLEECILELLGKCLGVQVSHDYFCQLRSDKKQADEFVKFVIQKYISGEYSQIQLNCIITILEIFKKYQQFNDNNNNDNITL